MVLSLLSSRNSKLRYPVAEWVAVKGSHAQPQSRDFQSHSLLPPTAQSHTQHHQFLQRGTLGTKCPSKSSRIVLVSQILEFSVSPHLTRTLLGLAHQCFTILAGLEPTIKEKHTRTQHCSQLGAEATQKPSPCPSDASLVPGSQGRREGASLWGNYTGTGTC